MTQYQTFDEKFGACLGFGIWLAPAFLVFFHWWGIPIWFATAFVVAFIWNAL